MLSMHSVVKTFVANAAAHKVCSTAKKIVNEQATKAIFDLSDETVGPKTTKVSMK